jgi:hypothetical protein
MQRITDIPRPDPIRLFGDIIWGTGHVWIYAGLSSIEWPPDSGNTYLGETALHASGHKDGSGKFQRVIESPLSVFGSTGGMVGRPR